MKLAKYILLLLFWTLISLKSMAQESKTFKNAVVVELAGNGLVYSFNYERHSKKDIYLRFGVSMWRIIENQTEKSITVMSYPISLNHLINLGNQKHYLDTGIGVMNLITTGNLVEYKGLTNYYLNPFVNLGYRYSPSKNSFTYKIGFSPFWGTKSWFHPTNQGFQPLGNNIQIWGYLGIGYRF
jgi:hypothetical protein